MVVASLTTIPPRIDNECRLALDSLMSQVDQVYLSVSQNYKRFGELILPHYLQEEPYVSKVTVVMGEDYGPASKYLGALEHILPQNDWVFVCDDDQEYHETLVKRMSETATNINCVYQNRHGVFGMYGTQGGYIHGFVGLFIYSSNLQHLRTFPLPECARFVDDQWMSAYCFFKQIPILPSGIEDYPSIYKVLNVHGFEKTGAEALANLGGRDNHIHMLADYFGLIIQSTRITKKP